MRTPLNGILGLTHLLSQTTTSVEQKEYMKNLSDISKRLARFSEVALLITSLRSKNQSIEFLDASVRILIDMALDEMKVMIENKNTHIKVNVENRDMLIVADSTLITKSLCLLLENILTNTPSKAKINIHAFETETENLIDINVVSNAVVVTDKAIQEFQALINGENSILLKNGNFSLAAVKLIQDAHSGNLRIRKINNKSYCITLVFKKY